MDLGTITYSNAAVDIEQYYICCSLHADHVSFIFSTKELSKYSSFAVENAVRFTASEQNIQIFLKTLNPYETREREREKKNTERDRY